MSYKNKEGVMVDIRHTLYLSDMELNCIVEILKLACIPFPEENLEEMRRTLISCLRVSEFKQKLAQEMLCTLIFK